jgi:short-subunit dehydrogenase involved in D-alanine esterification of teichoic acids
MENYAKPMFNEPVLEGKTIIVTGGGTGLGKSMSKYYGSLGANVWITGRREEKLKVTCDEFKSENIKCGYTAGDVRKNEDVIRSLLNLVKLMFC